MSELASPVRPGLPRKRVAAGALFVDKQDRVLLVNPTYKPLWEIPGGMVEADESPLAACRREIMEEIGLAIEPSKLLSVGYLQAHNANGDAIRFIFWGGRYSFAIWPLSKGSNGSLRLICALPPPTKQPRSWLALRPKPPLTLFNATWRTPTIHVGATR
jgi:ADP-ribose pyrophosphatase YjhB (NUDIX family)